jgi:hypothetical protein
MDRRKNMMKNILYILLQILPNDGYLIKQIKIFKPETQY